MATGIFILIAYLIGSISFAVIVSRMFGLPDPHSYGSGNPGATNVLRTGRKTAAALTLLGDTGKGWVAVMAARYFAVDFGVDLLGISLVAFAAFIGHLYPVFFRFKGGKGVATALGILFALDIWLGAASLATWVVIVLFFRIVSLASIVAALFASIYAAWLFGTSSPLLPGVLALSVMLIFRHGANIRRLLDGTENRIGARKQTAPEVRESSAEIQDTGKS